MQKSFENDTNQIVQVLNQQSHGDESKVIMQINRFSDQLDFKYSQYLSQNPESNNAIISYQPEQQQQSVNYQIKLLCDTNDDQKLQFFRSSLYVWLFWESVMFIILLFNVFQIDKYCNQKIGFIEFGSLLMGLFALVLIKHVNQKKLVCLDVINNNNIDKIFLFMVIVAQGFFHVKLIGVIECHCVGNRNYAGEYNYKLEREIIYVGILIHLSILISIGFILVITLIQQKIDPKQYFMISFVISLILGIMYQAAQLKIELIPFLLIVLIFCLFGTLTVLSGQQITNGKFYLNQKQKYMGALLLYTQFIEDLRRCQIYHTQICLDYVFDINLNFIINIVIINQSYVFQPKSIINKILPNSFYFNLEGIKVNNNNKQNFTLIIQFILKGATEFQ